MSKDFYAILTKAPGQPEGISDTCLNGQHFPAITQNPKNLLAMAKLVRAGIKAVPYKVSVRVVRLVITADLTNQFFPNES